MRGPGFNNDAQGLVEALEFLSYLDGNFDVSHQSIDRILERARVTYTAHPEKYAAYRAARRLGLAK